MADEYGECIVTQRRDPATGEISLTIEHADPRILIAPELLEQMTAADWWPATYDGHVLRIRGTNRTVVYRILDVLEPVPGAPGYWNYVGEWPD